MSMTPLLTSRLQQIPNKPGIYLMKNEIGEVLYIGKARSLRNRVRSYFQGNRNHSPRTRLMVSQVHDLDYILTHSEMEAFLLESNLIREKKPKYNVLLKDDKHFPYVKITVHEDYPRILKVRRIQKDGARYFGPYLEGDLNRTLDFIQKNFPLRKRNKPLFKDRPCLNYQIGRCLGPCQKLVSPQAYKAMVDQVILFLSGRQKALLNQLKQEMDQASDLLDFEKAARIRDLILRVERMISYQTIISTRDDNQDILGYAQDSRHWAIVLLKIREGRLVQSEDFLLPHQNESPEEVLESFIKQRYSQRDKEEIPNELLLPCPLEEQDLLESWLSQFKQQKVKLKTPQRGKNQKLIQMAIENAQEHLKTRHREESVRNKSLEEIAQALGIPSLNRIEAFDISHIQGSDTVASMVVFAEGRPKKSDYRKFKIRTVSGVDDFSSMYEVIARRYSKNPVPELILIDGGKGQLNAALKALKDLSLVPKAIIGLAKQEEEIFLPGRSTSLKLKKDSPAFHLIQQVRDEAHRFAVTFHRQLRSQRMTKSFLDHIPGLGEKRKQLLLSRFSSIEDLRKISLEELIRLPLPSTVAEAVYQRLRAEG